MVTDKKHQALKRVFWDYQFSEDELLDLLNGKVSRAGHLDTAGLYARMLSTLQWYDILDVAGKDRMQEMLSDPVLGRIHSANLRKNMPLLKEYYFNGIPYRSGTTGKRCSAKR